MSSSYQLKSGVFLVSGALRGALLDTNSQLVYSINDDACSVLRYEIEDDVYWQTLASMGLAEQTDVINIQTLPEKKDTESLRFVWFEIVTDDCNERCTHCYADSMPRTYRSALAKQGNLISIEQPSLDDGLDRLRMQHSNWLTIIQQAYLLGCRACQFIGGEPFLYKGQNGETVLDLVKFARQTGYGSVEVYTNATLLTVDKIRQLKDLGAKVAVSLYSDDPQVHDNITRTPGSHAKTVLSLKLLKEFDVPTRVEMVLMKSNQHTVDSTLVFRRELGHTGKRPDPLRPKGRGDNPLLQPNFENLATYGLKLRPNFTANRETIAHYKSGHSCLLGKITVTEFGDVLPCIFTRNHTLGNVLVSKNLKSIVESRELRQIWHTTKDNVMVCKDCEYRYVCFDCRPLSESVAAGHADYLSAPYPRCTYNPYLGEWAGGLWRVSEDGEPIYDRSYGAQIQQAMQRHSFEMVEDSSH
jgi:radical SAM protein with 4Fe4S-binding SPASM domain